MRQRSLVHNNKTGMRLITDRNGRNLMANKNGLLMVTPQRSKNIVRHEILAQTAKQLRINQEPSTINNTSRSISTYLPVYQQKIDIPIIEAGNNVFNKEQLASAFISGLKISQSKPLQNQEHKEPIPRIVFIHSTA